MIARFSVRVTVVAGIITVSVTVVAGIVIDSVIGSVAGRRCCARWGANQTPFFPTLRQPYNRRFADE
ncbi:MAG: hypothetical protein OXU98_10540 [Gammaproteobacteria bacterium]|nr:hypothetical protein [Gammaproteobacteria bacterium]